VRPRHSLAHRAPVASKSPWTAPRYGRPVPGRGRALTTAQGLGALVPSRPPSSGAGLPQPRSFTSPRLGPPAAPHPHRAARPGRGSYPLALRATLFAASLPRCGQIQVLLSLRVRLLRPGAAPAPWSPRQPNEESGLRPRHSRASARSRARTGDRGAKAWPVAETFRPHFIDTSSPSGGYAWNLTFAAKSAMLRARGVAASRIAAHSAPGALRPHEPRGRRGM
jgi:hypothetical protein